MLTMLKQIFSGNGASKLSAKSRLHFVLVQDRSGLSNDEMTRLKTEMLDVVKRYFVIDDQGFEVEYKRDSGSTTLLINSPILRRKEGHSKTVAAHA